MIKACVFDLDGTLAETLDSMASIVNALLQERGLKTLPVRNFRYYCGEGASVLVKRCLLDAGDTSLSFYEEMEKAYRAAFNENPMYHVTPCRGIPEVLHILHEKGIPLGVCTNKPHAAAVKVVEGLFPGVFDVIMGQTGEYPRKPAPDGALRIALRFGVKPEECLYAGDSGTDMRTGRAAGMKTVGVLWGYREREELLTEGAQQILAEPAELLRFFETDGTGGQE